MAEEFFANIQYSRRLLLRSSSRQEPPPPPPSESMNNTFDANAVMVIAVLLCALICSLGVNSIIRCACRCSNLANADSRAADTGIKKKALKTFPTVTYSAHLKLDTDCAICLSEFAAGERVRLMPACNHGFHVHCVDKWLTCHSSCPTCRRCLAENCNTKMVEIVNARPQEVGVRMQPLLPERAIRNHGI